MKPELPLAPLHERFHKVFPKRGTQGSQLEALKTVDDPQLSALAGSVDTLACQMAEGLRTLATEATMARGYEKGYPTFGPASRLVRGKAAAFINPDLPLEPSRVAAQKLS